MPVFFKKYRLAGIVYLMRLNYVKPLILLLVFAVMVLLLVRLLKLLVLLRRKKNYLIVSRLFQATQIQVPWIV